MAIYAIIPSGIYYTSTFNVDAGIFYRREALASQVGGHTCHSLGVMAKMEYVLDNPSFVIPRIGFKMQMPLLSFTRGETRVIVDGISIGAYVTIGFGE